MGKLINILEYIFSITVLIALFGGGVVFILHLIALIIGGDMATSISVFATDGLMPYFIRIATVGILSGLITFYISKEHHLSL